MPQPSFDVKAAHRWFAIELNNQSWSLLETRPKTPRECAKLLHGAHASAHHWYEVGTVANHARAECLVANAHAAVGDGETALFHAKICVTLTESHPDVMEDWDLAFAHDAVARAFAAAGSTEPSAAARRAAREFGDRIADEAEKKVFDGWFATHTVDRSGCPDA